MKEIKFEKGGGQVQKTGSAGSAPKNGGVKKAGKQPVDVKLPALSDDMLRTLTTLLKDPNTRENVKGILKNMGWIPSQIQGFIDLQSNKKSQGASSKLRTEVGYKAIGNAKVPKKSDSSHSRNNIDILTDASLSESQRRAALKKANGWTDAQVTLFLKKQVGGTPAKGHLEIGDAYETMGMPREQAYEDYESVSDEEARNYSKRIFGTTK